MDHKVLHVTAVPQKKVAIIGSGFFGLMAAVKLVERGFSVTVFEKDKDIFSKSGASYANQNRIHMGYHYPRSYETAKSSLNFEAAFSDFFKGAAVDNFDYFYCVARNGSLVTGEEYLKSCNNIGLPYEVMHPTTVTVPKDMIELSIRVPERLFDIHLIKKQMHDIIDKKGIGLKLAAEVTDVKKADGKYYLSHKSEGELDSEEFDALVNTTYSGINYICSMLGVETEEYQYELCEVPIMRVPWQKRTGVAIMDGPFFGILPFGFSNEYMLWDVELSVLESTIGKFPIFKNDIGYYDSEPVKAERIKRYIEKAGRFIKEMKDAKHLYSLYTVKIVPKNREHDDARPTEVIDHGDGFWSVFSGKVSACIPAGETIADEMVKFFNGNGVND